jgi:hypothetical protein
MQRVKSDELNADDEECPKEDKKEEKITPIGAGLPLLQRLRLLKEKQVRFDAFTYSFLSCPLYFPIAPRPFYDFALSKCLSLYLLIFISPDFPFSLSFPFSLFHSLFLMR